MSISAKPKSSTPEAPKSQKKRRTIKRCSESDEEGTEDEINDSAKPKTTSEITKPKTSTIKQQVAEESSDSDHEDEEDSEEDEQDDEDEGDEESSDDEQTNTKKPTKVNPLTLKKQISTKTQASKRRVESDDDVAQVASKSKKPKTQPAASSSSKKKTAIPSKRRYDNDSEDDIIELTSKSIKTKSKTAQTQSAKSSSSTLTKKQTFKASKEPEVETDSKEEDSSDDEEAPNVVVTEHKGNLFDAPPNTLLLHACNCMGVWGAGIALALKKNYPHHFKRYKEHCESTSPNLLLSTCLLIPPQPTGPKHWVGCLFTSRKYGRGKDTKDDIMDNTDSALQDMLEQLENMGDNKPKYTWMCKINSGSFKVPWSQTKALIEALTFREGLHIQVVDKK
ncbi:hypothetical protein QM012_003048 [Aureobasidium pullulans]|uniref:ADP-ribose 1''-phosphate phosphatase n=1 Tax=Aureobasidium pullulans TaxID=5580 RepID=A0ABR0TAG4_AURPU